MQENPFGLAHLWSSGDSISHAVAVFLLILSVGSWYLIVAKSVEAWRLRQAARRVTAFWAADSLAEGLARLGPSGHSPFAQLAGQARTCSQDIESASSQLAARFNPSEQMERTLRQQLSAAQSEMERGLTMLATVGATAPFVGLFGTVWGIYHALVAIGITGQAALEKIAGPVGEALIMTAAGLAVALPAVFAYNCFTRTNRVVLAELDAFAHDLHAFFTIGKPLAAGTAQVHPLHARALTGRG